MIVAKINENNWLPLSAHAKDVAEIMLKLYQFWMPQRLIDHIHYTDGNIDISKICKFCGYVHDIGKATAVFQNVITKNSIYFQKRYKDIGIDITEFNGKIYGNDETYRHEYLGESILVNYGCPKGIASIIGAHHGKPYCIQKYSTKKLLKLRKYYLNGYEKADSDEKIYAKDFWENQRKYIFMEGLKESGYKDVSEIEDVSISTQIILSGLLIMADWIASNEELAPLIKRDEDIESIQYPERINAIWDKLSLPERWMPTELFMSDDDFEERFGFTPNIIQKDVIKAVETSITPGLYILEAGMGSGKTEAALAAAEILASKFHCEGIYFGLPTQATANGIFGRITSWAEKQSNDEGIKTAIELAHGSAFLNPEYRDIDYQNIKNGNDTQRNKCIESGLIVHKWFKDNRKKNLLPTFIIGTIDQLISSALQEKHFMLKFLGAAGKVVIIDECHAYSAYMNGSLDRTIEYLGKLGTPVILLSATLPVKRRKELIKAYCGKEEFTKEENEITDNKKYPLLTYTQGDMVLQKAPMLNNQDVTVDIEKRKSEEVEDILKDKLSCGGCAGVIMNTIKKAQDMATRLQSAFPEKKVILIHARFTGEDRTRLENEVLSAVGKRSTPDTRDVIVVGTQVLEQSLDIDFDVLISEAAPMDLLLQRIGRLHRHKGRIRPDKVKNPVCIIIGCDDIENKFTIYDKWLLINTIRHIPEHINIPSDISNLVQSVYADSEENDELRSKYEKYMDKEYFDKVKALNNCIRRYSEITSGTMHEISVTNENGLSPRDIEPSISVIIMSDDGEGAMFINNNPWRNRIPYNRIPTKKEAVEMIKQSVKLPSEVLRGSFFECLEEITNKEKNKNIIWKEESFLKNRYFLILSNMEADLCGYKIRYDNFLGLSASK